MNKRHTNNNNRYKWTAKAVSIHSPLNLSKSFGIAYRRMCLFENDHWHGICCHVCCYKFYYHIVQFLWFEIDSEI